MKLRALLDDERGASLLLALAFVTFMGVFSVSILAFTGVGSATSTIVAGRADQRYAADAGMEYGIANLAADATKCAASGSYTWPVTTVNGRTVTYGCTWVSGGSGGNLTGSPALGEHGTIVTGASGISVGSANPTGVQIRYEGSVHSAGALAFGRADRQAMTVDGNLSLAGTCPTANVTLVSPGACTASAAAPTLPPVSVYVPTDAAAAPTGTAATCMTLYPGRYGSGSGFRRIPNFSATGKYHLASGVYYVTGVMTLEGTVFGGAIGASESKAMSADSPCASEPAGTGYSGSGVTFVLGDGGSLRVGGASTKVELFSRVPGGLDADATPGIGVWAGPSSSVLAGSGDYVASTSATPVSTTHHSVDLVVHGLTYVQSTATANVQVNLLDNSEAGGESVFAGGIVTPRLSVSVSNGDTSNETMTLAGSGGFSSAPRVVTLASTAAGTDGTAPTTITATVRPDGTPTVSGWRSEH